MRVSREQLDLIRPLLEPVSDDLVRVFSDPARLAALREMSEPLVHPEAEVSFHGAGGMMLAGPFRGLAGLVQGWRDWLSTFASYRVEIEDVLEHGDGVVVLVRQTGRTIHGGVEVPSSPSAAVIALRDGRVARVAFYLDRTEAAAAEGFELP